MVGPGNTEEDKMPQVEIRPLREQEIPEVAAVYMEAFNEAKVGERWGQESAEEFTRHWYGRQPDLFFTAVSEGKIVGATVAGVTPWWNGNHLTEAELCVLPAFQKRGIAKKLLKRLLEEGSKIYNVVEFQGTANDKAEFPIQWYQRLGMEKTPWVLVAGDVSQILQNLK